MAEIQLLPEHGGDPIDVPNDKITIGRGAFMKVTDKRVSRKHATLEINSNRELIITPIHTNPCFMKVKSTGEKLTLPKDKPQVLHNGDLLGLLPDSLYFRVVYKGQDNGEVETSDTDTESCVQNEEKNNEQMERKDEKPVVTNNKEKDARNLDTEEQTQSVTCGGQELALPLKKSRVLPDWMIGAAKRISLNSQDSTTNNTTTQRKIAVNAQLSGNNQVRESDQEEASQKPPLNRRGRGAPRKRAIQESDEEDWLDEEPPRSKRGRRQKRHDSDSDKDTWQSHKKRRRFGSDSDESESDEPQIKKREPRMSAQKLLTYKDEFDLGEVGLSSSDSEVGGQFGSYKKDDDSDFVIDDYESGSDWEMSHSQGSRRGKRKGRTRSATQTRGRRKSTRKGRKQSYNDSELDFEDDDDDDVYVPRPSKRRASNSKHQKNVSEDEDSKEKKRKIGRGTNKQNDQEDSKKSKQPEKQAQSDQDESMDGSDGEENMKNLSFSDKDTDKTNKNTDVDEDDSEEEQNRHRSRRPCMYGKKCYRKNPLHFDEFCHPGDSSYDEAEPNDVSKKDKSKKGVREKGEDDADDPNTFDYDDNFLTKDGSDVESSSSSDNPTDEDSDWSPEEENVRSLIKEAKGFIRNRKMQRPARNK